MGVGWGRSSGRSLGLFGRAQENQSSGHVPKVMVLQSSEDIGILWAKALVRAETLSTQETLTP